MTALPPPTPDSDRLTRLRALWCQHRRTLRDTDDLMVAEDRLSDDPPRFDSLEARLRCPTEAASLVVFSIVRPRSVFHSVPTYEVWSEGHLVARGSECLLATKVKT